MKFTKNPNFMRDLKKQIEPQRKAIEESINKIVNDSKDDDVNTTVNKIMKKHPRFNRSEVKKIVENVKKNK